MVVAALEIIVVAVVVVTIAVVVTAAVAVVVVAVIIAAVLVAAVVFRVVSNTNEKYCNTDTNTFFKKVLPIPIAILLQQSIANINTN